MRFIPLMTAIIAMLLVALAPGGVMAQDNTGGETLKQQLDDTNAAFSKRVPEEVINNINNAVHEVADSGILDRAKKLGDRAPDFELPNAVGETVKLSDLLARGPVILTWYRGNW